MREARSSSMPPGQPVDAEALVAAAGGPRPRAIDVLTPSRRADSPPVDPRHPRDPHLAAMTDGALVRMAADVARGVLDALARPTPLSFLTPPH